MPDSASAAEAPSIAGMSESISGSSETTVAHDLHFVEEAVREQRADRAVDQARGQRLFLGRTTFALEEAARDAARGVGLLDVVDGQREEVLARVARSWRPTAVTRTDGVAHRDEDRTVGLAGEAPVSMVTVWGPY